MLSDSWKEEARSSQKQSGVSFRPGVEILEQLKSQLKQPQDALSKLTKDEYGLPPADVEVHARAVPDSNVIIIETKGVSNLCIRPSSKLISRNNLALLLDNTKIPLPSADWKEISFKLTGDSWGINTADTGIRKRPGIIGPVSDAFNHGFLCVIPTGKPWNVETAQFADTLITGLKKRWLLQYRGELPVKKGIEVTNEDMKWYNLILFGDPGSNKIIKDVVSQMSKKQKPGGIPLYLN